MLQERTRPGFITLATPQYEPEAEELYRSAVKHGVSVTVIGCDDQGSWARNTRLKAHIIREQITLLDRPIVWVDADARFRAYPTYLFEDLSLTFADFAAHYRKDKLGYRLAPEYAPNEGELLGGTLYFNNTDQSKAVLDEWILENEADKHVWEQKNLQKVVHRHAENEGLLRHELPKEYCMITAKGASNMGTDEEAVIAHTQASRRLRNVRAF